MKSSLKLAPATFGGYSIAVWEELNDNRNFVLSPDEIVTISPHGSIKQFEMVDSQGNAVAKIPATLSGHIYWPDFSNLIQGETYTLSWFKETTYYEYKMVANSPYYTIDSRQNSTYSIEGELHKEGYASFDFSDIPPGLYHIVVGGFISIPE